MSCESKGKCYASKKENGTWEFFCIVNREMKSSLYSKSLAV